MLWAPLSDAFLGEPGYEDDPPGDYEAHVTAPSVRFGRSASLLGVCGPLRGYSWLVDAIRRHKKACGDLGEAVDRALREMPDDFSIRGILVIKGGGEGHGHLGVGPREIHAEDSECEHAQGEE